MQHSFGFFLHNGRPHVVPSVSQLCFLLIWECLVSSGHLAAGSQLNQDRQESSVCVCEVTAKVRL